MKLQERALQLVAGAYALGTLSPRSRRRFEALLTRDIVARRAWQQWEQRLSALAPDLPPVRPPDKTWQAIEQRLEQQSPPQAKSPLRWLLAAALVVGIACVVVWRKLRL
ncbi:MAG: hypothetical protein ABI645_09600 [Pseudomonadota bacterium]